MPKIRICVYTIQKKVGKIQDNSDLKNNEIMKNNLYSVMITQICVPSHLCPCK